MVEMSVSLKEFDRFQTVFIYKLGQTPFLALRVAAGIHYNTLFGVVP
jgi:hypothetical protein